MTTKLLVLVALFTAACGAGPAASPAPKTTEAVVKSCTMDEPIELTAPAPAPLPEPVKPAREKPIGSCGL